ncbi:MAG: hypothetical protein K5657_04480 [Desulfovibrio sp.]|nr:hypothetical protein [Desulfovibrio sp.]
MWLRTGRDKKAAELMAMGYTRDHAYAKVTAMRTRELETVIHLTEKMTVESPALTLNERQNKNTFAETTRTLSPSSPLAANNHSQKNLSPDNGNGQSETELTVSGKEEMSSPDTTAHLTADTTALQTALAGDHGQKNFDLQHADEAKATENIENKYENTDTDLSFLQADNVPETKTTGNAAAALPSAGVCQNFFIGTKLYYGHFVPRPFMTLNLRVKKARRIAMLKVNNYEIRNIKRFSTKLPHWKKRNDRIIDLNLYSDTVLNNISIVYADGTTCTIDNITIQKDMTNPYN